jgi:hypothetical protein
VQVTKKHCTQALLLLLATLLVLFLVIFIPWQSKWSFYAEQQLALSERLTTYNKMLHQKVHLEERLSVVSNHLNNSELFFRSATAELAGAELQRRIRSLVDTTDAKLISTQNLGVTSEAGQNRIAVRVRLTGDMDAVSKILYELETEAPVTIIQNLSMRAKRVSMRRRRGRQIEVQNIIDINFDLSGFLRLNDR